MNTVSLSERLLVPSGPIRNIVDHVIQAIDRVHSVLDLPLIPVQYTDLPTPFARYRPNDRQPAIELSTRGPHPRLSLTHEIGHLLDHALGDFGVYSSEGATGPLHAILREADRTDAIRELRDMRSSGTAFPLHSYLGQVDYWLQPPEIWARVYAQYIALRAGNDEMMLDVQFARMLEDEPVMRNAQWSELDFEPVADTVDTAFQILGWR